MYHKRRLLLGTIAFLHHKCRLDRMTLIKILFLLTQEQPPPFSMYSFHAYDYGPFSRELYLDLNFLARGGFLVELEKNMNPAIRLTPVGYQEGELTVKNKEFIKNYLDRYPTTEELVQYVYSKYPDYITRSKLVASNQLPDETRSPLSKTPEIFTIGYQGRSIDAFIFALQRNRVKTVMDVRYNARSMKFHFNKKRLDRSLASVGIDYEHLPQLGIPPAQRRNLETNDEFNALFQSYARSLREKEKNKYIEKIAEAARKTRLALMCFERKVKSCHRREIAKKMAELNIVPIHL